MSKKVSLKALSDLDIAAIVEEQGREAEAQHAAMLEALRDEAFLVSSLGDWLEVVRRCRIPHPETRQIGELHTKDVWARMEAKDDEGVKNAFDARLEAIGEKAKGGLLRYDICAPMELKMDASEGKLGAGPDLERYNEWAVMIGADIRLLDLLQTHPREVTPLWRREWVQPDVVRGYPMELRVWIYWGEVAGVANYYPQRALTKDEVSHKALEQALEWTAMLAKAVPQDMHASPAMGARWQDPERRQVSFTADWLIVEGEAVWLESNPATFPEWGGHPCSMDPQRLFAWRRGDPRMEAWRSETGKYERQEAGPPETGSGG